MCKKGYKMNKDKHCGGETIPGDNNGNDGNGGDGTTDPTDPTTSVSRLSFAFLFALLLLILK